MLYDSDSLWWFTLPDADLSDSAAKTVPLPPQLLRHGFEIVDKRSGKEVYLDGSGRAVPAADPGLAA